MNAQPPSERDLESFLSEEDSGVAAIYRKLPRSEPDAALDAAVLAMAQRAVASVAPARRQRTRWMPVLSAAAVIALAAGVALRVGPRIWQRPAAVPTGEPSPAAAQRADSAAPPVHAKSAALAAPLAEHAPTAAPPAVMSAPATPAAAADIARMPMRQMQKVENAASRPAPQAFPPQSLQLETAAPSAAPKAAADAMQPRARLAAPQSAAALLKDAPQQQALDDIYRLLRESRRDDALRALADFHKRYPDYPLPKDLRDLR